jgi:5'-3' exonuclease
MSVLLVDGDNLLTIGFYGVKNYFYKGTHIGGIYHFLNTLRKTFELYRLEKIVVFWDGQESYISRRKIYHQYKLNRKSRLRSDEEISSYNYQRTRVKRYLEEIYVRQGEYEFCETDDCISYYIKNSPNENIIIYSTDGDLTQLVSERVQIYNPYHGKIYNPKDVFPYKKEDVLIENVKIAKIFCGDDSDNIFGIRGLGIKTALKLFPELKTTPMSVNDVVKRTNELFENDKHSNIIKNILTGVTKEGVLGEEFVEINEKIVSLDIPYLTEEAKDDIQSLITENLDPEGRSYKNTLKMMVEDGLFNVLPKTDDAWINFVNPFLRLTRKEKNRKSIKIKSND